MLKDEFFPSLLPEFLFQSSQELNPLFKEVFPHLIWSIYHRNDNEKE